MTILNDQRAQVKRHFFVDQISHSLCGLQSKLIVAENDLFEVSQVEAPMDEISEFFIIDSTISLSPKSNELMFSIES